MAARRKSKETGSRRGWWWLAVPLVGVAAYAAFDATLGLVTPRDEPARVASPESLRGGAPRAAATIAAETGSVGVGAAAPSAATAEVASVAPAAGAEPTATPTAARVAAEAPGSGPAAQAKGKSPRPHEHLTAQDKRALDAVLERATGQKAR